MHGQAGGPQTFVWPQQNNKNNNLQFITTIIVDPCHRTFIVAVVFVPLA
jgi:hypothetical protein